jgi:D-glutamate cyclase
MKLTENDIKLAADGIDRLVCAPIGSKFFRRTEYPLIHLLYEAARKKSATGDPLTYQAARALVDRVKPGDNVLFLTGWYLPMYMIGENDGPPGSAGLARSINFGLSATPIVFSESGHIEIIKACFKGAGFRLADDLKEARKILRRAYVASPLSPRMDEARSREIIRQQLDEINPAAVIAVEKASPNTAGLNHSLPGRDITPLNAKYHLLVEEARRRGILTIGCGDGGNEIGMGNVHEEVKQYLATGATCHCGCGAGAAATTKTDILVVGFISNWAAYGIEAALALLIGRTEVMHDGEIEERVLKLAADAGSAGPPYGFSEMGVDELPSRFNIHLVEQLKYSVTDYLHQTEGRAKYMERIKELVDLDRWIEEEYANKD